MIKDRALFLYGFDITQDNRYLNFKNASLGAELTATLTIGNYTATEVLAEIKRAMELADGVQKYTWTIDRSVSGGLSNQISVSTDGSFLSILFGSGSNSASSVATMIGFTTSDYTGATSYTGAQAGTILYPDFAMWNYTNPDQYIMNDGSKNVSASGIKETLVFAQMKFAEAQWKYITDFGGSTQATEWSNFLKYATKQLKFEFTPSVGEDLNAFYKMTLESTPADSNGMSFKLNLMVGVGLYRFYDTGMLKFRVVPS